MNLIKDRHGYSLTFWTVFFGFVLIPILALSIELGRYFYAGAKIAKAAAAAEISQRVFVETGDLQTTSKSLGIGPGLCQPEQRVPEPLRVNKVVTGINVDLEKDKVLVQVSANLYRLFPSVMPNALVTETG